MIKKITSILLSVLIILGLFSTFVSASAKDELDVPRITFTTENGNGTSLLKTDGYVNASVKIEDVDGTSLSDDIIMKVRGNSTAFDSIAKKSYNFKFGKKKNVLNMGSGKKWAIISNIFDPTLARNYVAFSLAKELGIRYTSDFKVVEVVVDGSFRGCYLLIEPVGDGKDRVDIDVTGNGGKKDFLLELEALREEDDVTYFKSNGIRFAVSEPDPPTDEQVSYIQSTMDDVISTIKTGSKEEIESKIDVSSFVKFYLLNEFLKTVDFDFSSLYFYYKDGKLCAGPPWDYDLSTGNVNENFSARYASSYNTDGLFISNYNLYKLLCAKDWFNDLAKAEFIKHYSYFADIPADGGVINTFYNTYEKVIKRNFTDAGWKVGGYYVNAMKTPFPTFKENWDFYVNWCKERVDWLTEYFGVDPSTKPATEEPTTIEPSTEEPSMEETSTAEVTTEAVEPTSQITIPTTESCSTEPESSVTESSEPVSEIPSSAVVTTETYEPVTEIPATTNPITDITETSEPATQAPSSLMTEPVTDAPEKVFTADFILDDNVIINLYYTQDYKEVNETDVKSAAARNRDTGEIDITGDGQINFSVVLKEGFEIDKILVDGKYKNLKTIDKNTYRVTKIAGGLKITVITKPESTTPFVTIPTVQPTVIPTVQPTDKPGKKSDVVKQNSNPKIRKANTLFVKAKTKTVKLKKLKKKPIKIKALTVKKAKGKVSFKLIKKGTSKKIRKHITLNKKGVIKFKRWKKAERGTYKVKIKITAKGNSKYKKKEMAKTVKIRIK